MCVSKPADDYLKLTALLLKFLPPGTSILSNWETSKQMNMCVCVVYVCVFVIRMGGVQYKYGSI